MQEIDKIQAIPRGEQPSLPHRAQAPGQVLAFPSRTGARVMEMPLFFLLSMTQVEDVLREAAAYPVPFSPGFIRGMAQWGGEVVPAISPEDALGLSPSDDESNDESNAEDTEKREPGGRWILVRSASEEEGKERLLRGMLLAGAPVQILSLPIEAAPFPEEKPLPDLLRIRGIYEWEGRCLVAPCIRTLLSGG